MHRVVISTNRLCLDQIKALVDVLLTGSVEHRSSGLFQTKQRSSDNRNVNINMSVKNTNIPKIRGPDNTRQHFPTFFLFLHRLRFVPNLTMLIPNSQSEFFYHVADFCKIKVNFLKDGLTEPEQYIFLLSYLT